MRSVIIGATRGLGLALTKKLLSEGHSVVAGTVERKTPEALKTLATQYSGKLLVRPADVTHEAEIQALAEATADFMQKADALCTVAGVLLSGDAVTPLHQCDITELRTTFMINALGPIIVAKYFYPVMQKGGKIITITSEGVGVWNAYASIPCYALSKTTATKASGILNASVTDVDFYAVHPGRMMSDMNHNGEITTDESAEGLYGIMTGQIPVSRAVWYIDYRGNPMEM